jgi:hypothetical protein
MAAIFTRLKSNRELVGDLEAEIWNHYLVLEFCKKNDAKLGGN